MLTPASRSTLQVIADAGARLPLFFETSTGSHSRRRAGFYVNSVRGLIACGYVEPANDETGTGYRATDKGRRALEALAAVDAIRAASTPAEKWAICKAASRAARG